MGVRFENEDITIHIAGDAGSVINGGWSFEVLENNIDKDGSLTYKVIPFGTVGTWRDLKPCQD